MKGRRSFRTSVTPEIPLHMDRALSHRQGRLLHRLGQRRVGVAGAGDVLGGSAELHGDGGFCDHIAGVGTKNVHSEHAVGLGVGKNLYKAIGLVIDLGAAVGGERKFSGAPPAAGSTVALSFLPAVSTPVTLEESLKVRPCFCRIR